MRFFRFLLNCVLFAVTAVIITFAQIGVYWLSSAQSKRIETIHVSSQSVEEVAYTDAYTFWAHDLVSGCKQPAKYRVRNFFSWNWWIKGTEWCDIAIDKVVAVVKPIIVPLAQVNAVAEYYHEDGAISAVEEIVLNDDRTGFDEELVKQYDSEDALAREAYEFFVCYRPDLVTDDIYLVCVQGYEGDLKSANTFEKKIGITLPKVESKADLGKKDIESTNYARWVGNNSYFYNNVWKAEKYNSEGYSFYFSKFIDEDPVTGERTIKTPVVVLYSMIYLALILALIFVICYPVSLIQARFVGRKKKDGSVSV